jgi:hypothetical protein
LASHCSRTSLNLAIAAVVVREGFAFLNKERVGFWGGALEEDRAGSCGECICVGGLVG